jgi:hypothetical protein
VVLHQALGSFPSIVCFWIQLLSPFLLFLWCDFTRPSNGIPTVSLPSAFPWRCCGHRLRRCYPRHYHLRRRLLRRSPSLSYLRRHGWSRRFKWHHQVTPFSPPHWNAPFRNHPSTSQETLNLSYFVFVVVDHWCRRQMYLFG